MDNEIITGIILLVVAKILDKYIEPLLPKPKPVYGFIKKYGLLSLDILIRYGGWVFIIGLYCYSLFIGKGTFWMNIAILVLAVINLIVAAFAHRSEIRWKKAEIRYKKGS